MNGHQNKVKGILERKNLEKPGLIHGFSSLYEQNKAPIAPNVLASKNGGYFRLSRAYYVQCLGYFCRQEIRLEKITSIPIRFRLGGHDYVNWLEQKPNAIRPR